MRSRAARLPKAHISQRCKLLDQLLRKGVLPLAAAAGAQAHKGRFNKALLPSKGRRGRGQRRRRGCQMRLDTGGRGGCLALQVHQWMLRQGTTTMGA